MNKFKLGTVALAVTLATAGCANMSDTQRGTASGAGIGAGIGALLGAVTGPGGGNRARHLAHLAYRVAPIIEAL